MADPIDDGVAEAIERGRAVRAIEPRATSVRYEPANGRVILELVNGATFAFPARLVQGLEQADEAQIAQVELLGAGYGLHWDALDIDVTVSGLLNGVFGTAAYMAARADRPTPAAPDHRPRKSA